MRTALCFSAICFFTCTRSKPFSMNLLLAALTGCCWVGCGSFDIFSLGGLSKPGGVVGHGPGLRLLLQEALPGRESGFGVPSAWSWGILGRISRARLYWASPSLFCRKSRDPPRKGVYASRWGSFCSIRDGCRDGFRLVIGLWVDLWFQECFGVGSGMFRDFPCAGSLHITFLIAKVPGSFLR